METKMEYARKVVDITMEESTKTDSLILTYSVAALGFSINSSINLHLDLYLLPLILAAFCWVITVIINFIIMKNRMNILTGFARIVHLSATVEQLLSKIDANLAKVKQGITEGVFSKEELSAFSGELKELRVEVEEGYENYESRISRYQKLSSRSWFFFIAGVILFSIWWLWKLTVNKVG